ncbi:MAG: hypothetical protein JW715_13840 [Sedimentisphaerales bacterium]|nr:hypothetical protein [Sedimentisphaerales bacterium]
MAETLPVPFHKRLVRTAAGTSKIQRLQLTPTAADFSLGSYLKALRH